MKARLFALFIFILGSAICQEPEYLVIENTKDSPLPLFNENSMLKIRLKNNLEACLISDPNARESLASLVVGVGTWSDPDQFPGLAHYLEHMLFMGTKKYPDHLEYKQFLAGYGGKANAMTLENNTIFYFNIAHTGFEGALDRFARAFYEPLLETSAMQKEIQAIDQEFTLDCASPSSCHRYVISHQYHLQHPASRFSGGNSTSLRNVSDADLKEWFDRHYSANRMRLIVYSALPLEEITSLVVNHFSAIPDKGLPPLKINQPILGIEQKKTITYIKSPLNNDRVLSMIWHLPSIFTRNLKAKSAEIIVSILNSKDQGSLYAWLKEEGLIESFSSCTRRIHEDLSVLELYFELTSKGLKEVESVILHCFETIKQLEKLPICDSTLKEVQQTHFIQQQQAFKHSPQAAIFHFIGLLAYEDISKFPNELLLIQSPCLEEIRKLIQFLSYENALISVRASSDSLNFDRVDKWLNHPFTVQPFSSNLGEKMKQLSASNRISLPKPNRFLSTRNNIATNKPITQEEFLSISPPCEIINQRSMRAFFSPTQISSSPSSFIRIHIKSPHLSKGDPYNSIMKDLFIAIWKDVHQPLISEAAKANIYCSLVAVDSGIQLTITGAQDSIERFADSLDLRVPLSTLDNFDFYKSSLIKNYDLLLGNAPLEVARKATYEILGNRPITSLHAQDLLKKMDKEKFQQFLSKLFVRTFTEGLIICNQYSEEEARSFMQSLQKKVGGRPYSLAPYRPIKKTSPIYAKTNLEGTANAAFLLIGLDKQTPQEKNIQDLLRRVLNASFFAELRTEQQVGYIVKQEGLTHNNHFFLSFGVQSASCEPIELINRYEFFLERFLKNLTTVEVPPTRFTTLKQSLLEELTTIPQDLRQWGDHLFSVIFEKNNLKWDKQRIEALKNLSYEEFIQSTQKILGRQNKQRLAILMEGQTPLEKQLRYSPYSLAKQEKTSPL